MNASQLSMKSDLKTPQRNNKTNNYGSNITNISRRATNNHNLDDEIN